MNIYVFIYLSIIGFGIICAIAFIAYKSIKQSQIDKKRFSEEDLLSYQNMVSTFKKKHNIFDEDKIDEIVTKIGLSIDVCPRKEMKGYNGKIRNKTITLADDLTIRQKNVTIAHEIAHYMRTEAKTCEGWCKTKTIYVRPEEEQVCDYIASIILLPNEILERDMEEFSYSTMQKNKKIQFVNEIADKYNVPFLMAAARLENLTQRNS